MDPETRDLWAVINTLRGQVGEVRESCAACSSAVQAELGHIRSDVQKLTRVLIDGNGGKPITARVDRLDSLVEQLMEAQNTIRKRVWALVAATASAVISAVAAWVGRQS